MFFPIFFHQRKRPWAEPVAPIGDTDYSALGYFSSRNWFCFVRSDKTENTRMKQNQPEIIRKNMTRKSSKLGIRRFIGPTFPMRKSTHVPPAWKNNLTREKLKKSPKNPILMEMIIINQEGSQINGDFEHRLRHWIRGMALQSLWQFHGPNWTWIMSLVRGRWKSQQGGEMVIHRVLEREFCREFWEVWGKFFFLV